MSIPAYSLTPSSVTSCENLPIDFPSYETMTSWVPTSSRFNVVSKSPLSKVFTAMLSAWYVGEIVVTATGIFFISLPTFPSNWFPEIVTDGSVNCFSLMTIVPLMSSPLVPTHS